jgi:O-antigen/teichoic acid export membrane protein
VIDATGAGQERPEHQRDIVDSVPGGLIIDRAHPPSTGSGLRTEVPGGTGPVDGGRNGAAAPRRSRAEFWRGPYQMVRRLSWGLADQVMSSLTNAFVTIYIARELGAVQFGAFSLAYVTYAVALNVSRGLATDPLMVRFSGTNVWTWRRAVARCTGTAAVVGFAAGTCVLAVGAVINGTAGAAFLALGITMPGLLLQDSWRYAFFTRGRGSQAFLNDTVWGVALLPTLVLLRKTGHANIFWFVLAWGATATVAAAVGPLQAQVTPTLSGTWAWVSRHRDLGPRYVAEGASSSVSGQLRAYGIGLILGLAALGYVQATSTLMGPVTIVFLGMSLVTIPEAARVLRRSPRHLPLFCLLVSVGLAVAALIWGVFLLVAMPRGFGGLLLGRIWRPTYPLVLPTVLTVVGLGIYSGAGTGLHALGASRRSLRGAVFASVASLVCGLVGAAAGGALGTVLGTAVAAWLSVLVVWWQLYAAMRESGHAPAGIPFWSSRRAGWHRRPIEDSSANGGTRGSGDTLITSSRRKQGHWVSRVRFHDRK